MKPIAGRLISWAPALVVITMITLRKSALRPLLSVSVPWSMTCSSMLKRSGMRLFDLIEQQHAVRRLGDLLGQQPALVKAHVARGRADQARDRVALHVLGHVEAHELDAHRERELARDLGLADTGRACEQEAADGLVGIAQARSRELDRAASASIAGSWPKITSFKLRSRFLSTSRSEAETVLAGIRAMRATTSSMSRTSTISARSPAGRRRRRAPASSITSMALSGSRRSVEVPIRQHRGRAIASAV
jgi:hypothetical protein